jgi:hypothetical protein
MIALTIDIDWAPEELIDDTIQLIRSRGLNATYFITHEVKNDFYPGERAIHPNFLTGEDPQEVLQRMASIVPEAVGVRSHSLVTSARLQELFERHNFKYSSNYYMEEQFNVYPFPYLGLTEFPIFFIDNLYVQKYANNKLRFSSPNFKLNEPGLKVFLFHPTNIFLNLESMDRHQLAKPFWKDSKGLENIRNVTRKGIRDVFISLLDEIVKSGLKTHTLSEILAMRNIK